MKKQTGKVAYQEINLFDNAGNQIYSGLKKTNNKTLGSGWVAFYKKKIRQLINECPNLSTMKVYMWLASKQTLEALVMATPQGIIEATSMSRERVFSALKWLQDNDYIQKHQADGNIGWLLNPKVTVNGGEQKKRRSEIWDLYKKKEHAQLEEDVEKRKTLIATLDSLIDERLVETNEEADEFDE